MRNQTSDVIRGAVIDPNELIAARFSARYIDVTRSTRALAYLAGAKRSVRRGRGVEFDEVRQYAAGDDVRAIDWRVTARSGEAHTKLFHEERERPVLVAFDLRRSMQFGSRNCFKSVLAAHAGCLLLWSALDRGERVGGMVVSGGEARDVRPRRSRRAILELIGSMPTGIPDANATDSPEMDLGEQLRQFQRILRPGSSLFLVSDFIEGLPADAMEVLRRLARHTQITAVAISDPLERSLPIAGRYAVADVRGRSVLNTADSTLRAEYQQAFEDQRTSLKSTLQGLRIPTIELETNAAPLPILQRYFPAR